MNIAFHTLGCKLNFSETSFIANDIRNSGFNEVDFNEVSDIGNKSLGLSLYKLLKIIY